MSSDEDDRHPGSSARHAHRQNLFGDDEVEVSGSGSESPRSQGSGSGSDNEDSKKKADKKDKKPKAKKPGGPSKRILLGEDHLTGKNGLLRLPEMFKDFKSGGKGNEVQDLDRVLHKLEHWIHVLHPRHPFDQTLERIEHLGSKKRALKTYIKKIRMDLVSNITGPDDYENLPDMGMSDDERNDNTNDNDNPVTGNLTNENSGGMEIDEANLFDEDDDFDDIINTIPEDEELLSQIEKNGNSIQPDVLANDNETNENDTTKSNAIVVDDNEFDRMMAEAGM